MKWGYPITSATPCQLWNVRIFAKFHRLGNRQPDSASDTVTVTGGAGKREHHKRAFVYRWGTGLEGGVGKAYDAVVWGPWGQPRVLSMHVRRIR